MLHLQNDLHCHNINLVSPTQWVPQIMGALNLAVPQGLRIPLIYNTNGYDSHTTLRLLDGIIDIYLPDIKYSSDRIAADYSQCSNYVKHCRNAIKEMYRQTGNLKTDKAGLATRGLIVRHLILPDNAAGSEESLQWLSDELSREITLSVMAQYHPCFHAMLFPALNRIISPAEYESVVTLLERLGFENGWLQEMDSAEHYLPDFNRREHPFSPG
jgi:putative pyruvate formate lyase activating enzyme